MHVYCSAFVHQLFGFHILLFQGNRVTIINAFTMTDMALWCSHHGGWTCLVYMLWLTSLQYLISNMFQ